MKQKNTSLFFVIYFNLSILASEKIENILEEWTLDTLQHVTSTLPHIAGRKSPIKTTNINLINIKKIPENFNEENKYWKKLSNWNVLFSYEKSKLVFENAKAVFEQKQESFQSKISVNQFFRRAYCFDRDDNIHVIGDLHGGGLHDIQTFFEGKLDQGLRIINKHDHFVFLGDMIDGGLYSLETLYFVMILFLKNKENIHPIRGNHEDIELNEKYGFFYELVMKYRDSFKDDEALGEEIETLLQYYINPFYATLPVVLFGIFPDSQLIVPFCHGTVDLNDTSEARQFLNTFLQMIQTKKSKEYFEFFYAKGCTGSGYQWNDHTVFKHEETTNSERDDFAGILKVVGRKDIKKWFQDVCPQQYHIPCVIRAHQHSMYMHDLMPLFFGHYYIAYLWDNQPLAFTLCVNPGSGFSLPLNNNDSNFCFPGILNSTTLTLSDAAKKIDIIRHQNTNISTEIKAQHIELFNKHLLSNKFTDYYHALFDDFAVYLDYKNINRGKVTEAHLKAFLNYVVTIKQKETIATFFYCPEKKRMKLNLFYLPQALQKMLKLSKHQVNEIHEQRRCAQNGLKKQPQELQEPAVDQVDAENITEHVHQENDSILKKISYPIIIAGMFCVALALFQQRYYYSLFFQEVLHFVSKINLMLKNSLEYK